MDNNSKVINELKDLKDLLVSFKGQWETESHYSVLIGIDVVLGEIDDRINNLNLTSSKGFKLVIETPEGESIDLTGIDNNNAIYGDESRWSKQIVIEVDGKEYTLSAETSKEIAEKIGISL